MDSLTKFSEAKMALSEKLNHLRDAIQKGIDQLNSEDYSDLIRTAWKVDLANRGLAKLSVDLLEAYKQEYPSVPTKAEQLTIEEPKNINR